MLLCAVWEHSILDDVIDKEADRRDHMQYIESQNFITDKVIEEIVVLADAVSQTIQCMAS